MNSKIPPKTDDGASVAEKHEPGENGAAFPIVGVGASAGGLEALTQLLKALPPDTGMGFVIVQHLAPAHASSLAEILARATKMPVCEVRDEPAVEPDHVYVIPPGRDMIISGGSLLLLPQERNARHRGIDQFFRSLAEDSGHQAIGVVLSGSATDGTLGLEVIKAEGGVTFAQDESAQHASMPKSAVASGCVDFVLPPEGIAAEIARIARHPYVAQPVGEEKDGSGDSAGHSRIAEIVRGATGVDFTHYKAATMQRRIQRRMMVHKIGTLAEYEECLRVRPGEIEALYQDVLISVTSFFRNPEAFAVLADQIFPKMLAGRTGQDVVRLWTPGCSTGEEAYSLAMLFAECAEAVKSTAQLQVFASDLNASCIERARVGRYPRSISQDVSPERLRKFFVEEDGHYRVNKSIRERVIFSRHNVLADPPFSRVDFISCRNLLIYLEPVLQQQVMPLLHYALKPGGHLWLGSSESVGTARALFDVEDARHKIFARRTGPTPAGLRLRAAQNSTLFPTAAPGPRETPQTMLHRDAERILLAKYAPPGVVVNAGLHVVQFRGETGAYLAPAAGLASHELLKMLREGLLVPVRAALERAEKEGRTVREEGARVKSNGGHRELAVEVIPIKAGPGRESGFVILFDEGARQAPPSDRSEPSNPSDPSDPSEILRLTQELAATREYLQSVIEQQDSVNEELQSANEEAQSANEEMQSVNEELETSKEEIQSSNEELATVNDELNHRNEELNGLNNDLSNVIASTQLSIVIVSRDLRIRRFTPVAEKTFNLAAGDLGRPLGDIKLSLTVPDLAPLLREVIDQVITCERDVQDAQGHWFSLLARPYLTQDKKIDGAVVTLMDVNTLRRSRDYAQNIVANVRGPLVVLDAALRVKTASRAFYEHFHVATAETVGHFIYDLGNRQWDIPALRTLLEEVLPQEHAVEDYEVRHTFQLLGPRIIMLNASRLTQSPDDEPLIILSLEDITERQRNEDALRNSEAHVRQLNCGLEQRVAERTAELEEKAVELTQTSRHKSEFLANMSHELRTPLNSLLILSRTLADNKTGNLSPPQMEWAKTIQASGTDLLKLIDEVLDLSKIEAGKAEIEVADMRLASVIELNERAFRPVAGERQLSFTLTLDPRLPVSLCTDSHRLQQILKNLLANAFKFTMQGGVELLIAPAHHGWSPDHERLNLAPRVIAFAVRDTGIGIAPDKQQSIFDAFNQAESGTARHYGGTGLGLAISRDFARLLGGTIHVESALGTGSTFTLYLPDDSVAERTPDNNALFHPDSGPDPLAVAVAPEVSRESLHGCKVLVVDDDARNIFALACLLENHGMDVLTATGGRAAIALIRETPGLSLVLMDIMMPGMDGYETMRELRQCPEFDTLPILALTAQAKIGDREKCLEAGASDYLSKPVNTDYLLTLMQKWVRR